MGISEVLETEVGVEQSVNVTLILVTRAQAEGRLFHSYSVLFDYMVKIDNFANGSVVTTVGPSEL